MLTTFHDRIFICLDIPSTSPCKFQKPNSKQNGALRQI
jgi:hypothetical protein